MFETKDEKLLTTSRTAMPRDPDLPDFGNPPVVEVVLSVQFEPIHSLKTIHLGLLWDQFRAKYPRTEEHQPLASTIESFDPVDSALTFRVEMSEIPPLRSVWFINQQGTELLQIQQDRFTHNWRKIQGTEPYPRYEPIKEAFQEDLLRFSKFLDEQSLEPLKPIQCEVTYVNHIEESDLRPIHRNIHQIFSIWPETYSDGFLSSPEDVTIQARYRMKNGKKENLGRLHLSIEPRLRKSDFEQLIRFVLTARGQPAHANIAGVLEFFDVGRQWIVKSFASVTTAEMHKRWERKDAQSG